MSAIEWLLLLILFNSNHRCTGSGESAKCKIRLDEFSSLLPGTDVYGPASIDHSYYIGLRYDNCGPSDYPSPLTAYTIAVIQHTGVENAPVQLSYFDLLHLTPMLKNDGRYRWQRTSFADVHDRMFIGNFPRGHGKNNGILLDWTSEGTSEAAVLRSSSRQDLSNSDDGAFLSMFLLIHSDKSNKAEYDLIKRLLSLILRDADSHRNVVNSFILANEFDANWKAIASKIVQVVAISLNQEIIQTSPIIAGLKRVVDEFSVVMLPRNSEVHRDIPKGKAVRMCSGRFVLTNQAAGSSHPIHCDDSIDDLVDLIVVPPLFDWATDYRYEEVEPVDDMMAGAGNSDASSGGPQPPKRPRMKNVEVILVHGGNPHLATAQSNEEYYLMANHDHQVSVSRQLFANSDDSGLRLRKLTSRVLYNFPFPFDRVLEGGLIGGLSYTMRGSSCERIFDLFSYVLSGSCIRADDIENFILKSIGKIRSDVVDMWNEKGGENSVPCHNLVDQLAKLLPFHIVTSHTDSDGSHQSYYKYGNQWTEPTIFIDVDEMKLFKFVNGMTDRELDGIESYNQSEDPYDAPSSEPSEAARSEAGYCEGGDQSELMRLTRESHAMLERLTEGATSVPEKKFVDMKMREFRRQNSFLLNLNDMKDDLNEIVESKLLSDGSLEHLLSDNRVTYIDMVLDKDRLRIWCNACKANGLTNVEHKRSVEWVITATTTSGPSTKSILDNIRQHHSTHHHIDSVRIFESKEEDKFLAEFAAQNAIKIDPKRTPTSIVIVAAYNAVKLAIPAYRFSDICQLLRDEGVPIGFTNTYRTSFMRIVEMIADFMTRRMIDHFRAHHLPFGMTLDTSTDHQGRVVLIIYLTAIIDGYPRELFYAAEYLTEGESGAAIYNAVINKFKKDGWLGHLDDYLIGMSTDGCPAMIGVGDGFGGRMIRRLENHRRNARRRGAPTTIPHVHCSAHRVELALRDAYRDIDLEHELQQGWSETINSVVNAAANLFSSFSAKRLESLRKTAADQHLSGSVDSFLQLKRVFAPRWTPTTLEALKTFTRMLKVLWNNLIEYTHPLTAETSSGNAAERTLAFRAQTFILIFKNLRFYEHLTFQVGILDCVQFLILECQRADGTIIDFPRVFIEFKTCITSFCRDPFNPYQPKLRESKKKQGAKPGQAVPFMRNVAVIGASGHPVPIRNSQEGKAALYGDKTTTLDALQFKLDFTTTTSTATTSHSKDTIFAPLNPLSDRRSNTPHRGQRVQYEQEQQKQIKEAQEQLDINKAKESLLLKTVEAANFPDLDQPLREFIGNTIISNFEPRFYSEMLEWAASFTVRSLIFDPNFGTASGDTDRENRKKMSDLFHLNSHEIELDIKKLRESFTAEVSEATRRDLKDAPTDIVLFHTALVGNAVYGKELETIIACIITLPINSAMVERGFSILNFYMSKRRTSLNIPHLSAYLFIHQNGPDAHTFNPDAYVAEWLKTRQQTELLQPDEQDDNANEEETEDHSIWDKAFSPKKTVQRITIFD